MNKPQIITSTENLDMLATTTAKVQASKLQECMVLMDPETGTPAMWLDHKMPTTRNSGQVTWMAHNLDTGRIETVSLRGSLSLAVLA